MKNISKFLLLTLICLTCFISLSNKTYALEFHDTADNVFAADLILNERADIDGDAFLVGETINFAGNTNGNIIALGNSAINISTDEFKNAFVMAKGNIDIKGDAKAIYAFGNSVKVNTNAKTAYLIGKIVTLQGKIDGDLTIIATQINLDQNLVVTGKLNIESPIEPEYPEGMLQDNVSYKKVEEETKEEKTTLTETLLRLSKFLLWLAPTGLITAIIYIKLLGPIKRQGVLLLKKAPLKLFLYGMLMAVGMPFVSFVFMIAIIGLPTALIVLMIYLILFLLAVPCFGVAFGDYILPKQTDLVAGVCGTLIISIFVAIPYVGVVVYVISLLYTYGMFSITIFELARKENRSSRRKENKSKSLVTKISKRVSTRIETRKNKRSKKDINENANYDLQEKDSNNENKVNKKSKKQ